MAKNELPLRRRRIGIRRNLENRPRNQSFENNKTFSRGRGGGGFKVVGLRNRSINEGIRRDVRRDVRRQGRNTNFNSRNRNFGGIRQRGFDNGRRNFSNNNGGFRGGNNNGRGMRGNFNGGRNFNRFNKFNNNRRGGPRMSKEERLNKDLDNYWKKDPNYAKNKLDTDLDDYKNSGDNDTEIKN